MHSSKTKIGFLKTTGIGGVLFLLPLIVLGALVGQIIPIVLTIAKLLGDIIPVPIQTPTGISLLIGAAILVLMFICFAAGIIARRSFGRRISATFEKNLTMLFPRYAIFKDQIAGTLGGDKDHPTMTPVMVRMVDSFQVAFEVDRSEKGFVTIFFPGSPDPWTGKLAMVESQQVQPLHLKFVDADSVFETLGRDSISQYETHLFSRD